MKSLSQILEEMWQDYCRFNPRAKKIHKLLGERGEDVENDHIALRTFRSEKLGIDSMARVFEDLGYEACKDYEFKVKKLYAKHYEHPDKSRPKIFISELKLEEFSPDLQSKVQTFIDAIPEEALNKQELCYSGRLWDMDYKTYEALAAESEYASWVAAYGFRPNHFTVNVNKLKSFQGLEDLNNFIEEQGYELNSSGGKIKGGPEEYLAQSSTMAEEVDVSFSDGIFRIPACYYEFAKRYPLPSGELYQGFVAASADKIFESTNRNQ